MRKAVIGGVAAVSAVIFFKEIIGAIYSLLEVLGVAVVYTILAGCVVSFIAMLLDIQFKTNEDDEPVYNG